MGSHRDIESIVAELSGTLDDFAELFGGVTFGSPEFVNVTELGGALRRARYHAERVAFIQNEQAKLELGNA